MANLWIGNIDCNSGQGLRHFTSELFTGWYRKLIANYFLSEKNISKDGNSLLFGLQAFVGRGFF